MKPILFGLVALCAQVGHSVPHGPGAQVHRHAQRHEVTDYSTITDVVTVTAPNAVVWVDQYDKVLYTEYRDLTTTSALTSDADTATATTPATTAVSSSTPAQSSSDAYVPSTTSDVLSSTSAAETSEEVSTTASSSIPSADSTTVASSLSSPSSSSSSATASSTGNDKPKTGDSASADGYGICYELVTTSGCKTLDDLNTDFPYLASQGFSKVRVYDIGCPLGIVAEAAASAGLQVVAGLNTIDNVAADIATLIGMFDGNWAPVDTIVVGNEVVNDGGSAAAVVAAIGVARPLLTAAGFTKNVVTVDVFDQIIANPSLCAASDYCAANCHAYFDPDTTADEAGAFVSACATNIAKIANGKSVVITESGWPYQGDANGVAVPSDANQVTAISSLKSAFSSDPAGLFLFQAYDATYKAPGSLGVEQYFGIYGH